MNAQTNTCLAMTGGSSLGNSVIAVQFSCGANPRLCTSGLNL
jgi:hypothetical protein